MITSLRTSLTRVILFWYFLGLFILFIGPSNWAQSRYIKLMRYANVPEIELSGISSALLVQLNLIIYWTLPVLFMWMLGMAVGFGFSEIRLRLYLRKLAKELKPSGLFFGVKIASYSMGSLPAAIVPGRVNSEVLLTSKKNPPNKKGVVTVQTKGDIAKVLGWLTPDEKSLCEELLGVLLTSPQHYAGAGHGVGLLEHTLNVLAKAAPKCLEEFRLPFIAAIAHDIGKLVTFKPDGKGGWVRDGLHSREGGRILATVPSFEKLPILEQRALILAVKYDHAPERMPILARQEEATALAKRIILALTDADRSATAEEKERNLVRLQPEDLLWEDFVSHLFVAPVVQRGKKKGKNQINNPDGPYIYLYEAPWRDEAIKRMPEEIAAALDLTRRDRGKVAKYTQVLAKVLREKGLLLEEYTDNEGNYMSVTEDNPLWDTNSGTIEIKGVLVLHANKLWEMLNKRISTQSPWPVTLAKPNAVSGPNPKAKNTSADNATQTSDHLKVEMVDATFNQIGLMESEESTGNPRSFRGRAKALKGKIGGSSNLKEGVGIDDRPSSMSLKVGASNESLEVKAQEDDEDAELQAMREEMESISEEPTNAKSNALSSAMSLVSTLPTKEEREEVNSKDVSKEASNALEKGVSSTPPKAAKKSKGRKAVKAKKEVSTEPAKLSRSEANLGIAIADEEAVKAYPHLTLGQKYYTKDSKAVKMDRGIAEGSAFPLDRSKLDEEGEEDVSGGNGSSSGKEGNSTAKGEGKAKTASSSNPKPRRSPSRRGSINRSASKPKEGIKESQTPKPSKPESKKPEASPTPRPAKRASKGGPRSRPRFK